MTMPRRFCLQLFRTAVSCLSASVVQTDCLSVFTNTMWHITILPRLCRIVREIRPITARSTTRDIAASVRLGSWPYHWTFTKSDLLAATSGTRPFANLAETKKEKPQPRSAKEKKEMPRSAKPERRKPIQTFSELESRFRELPRKLSIDQWKEMFSHLSRLASPEEPEAHRLLHQLMVSLLRGTAGDRDLRSLTKALLLMHYKGWTNMTIMEQMCDLFLSSVDFGSIVTPSLTEYIAALGEIYKGRGIPLHSHIVDPAASSTARHIRSSLEIILNRVLELLQKKTQRHRTMLRRHMVSPLRPFSKTKSKATPQSSLFRLNQNLSLETGTESSVM